MQPASVFVVEDEAMVADDLKKTLVITGYAVAGTAKTGNSAREKIAETKSDLVLMDIHLAGTLDGIGTAG